MSSGLARVVQVGGSRRPSLTATPRTNRHSTLERDFNPFELQLGLEQWRFVYGTMEPFETRSANAVPLDLPVLDNLQPKAGFMDLGTMGPERVDGCLEFGCAIYVVARGPPPQWYQIVIRTFPEDQQPVIRVIETSRTASRPRVFVRFGNLIESSNVSREPHPCPLSCRHPAAPEEGSLMASR